MPSLHIALTTKELSTISLSQKIVILVDALFGTTTIVDALGNGAHAVVIKEDANDISAETQKYQSDKVYTLTDSLNAFPEAAIYLPSTLHGNKLEGKTLIYKASSIHSALKLIHSSDEIYAGSLLNGPGLAHAIAQKNHKPDIVFVCAGEADNFNLEDFFCTGYLVDLFGTALGPGINFSDAALGARFLYRGGRPTESMLASRIGRAFVENELEEAVRYASQRDKFEVVPKYVDGKFIAI